VLSARAVIVTSIRHLSLEFSKFFFSRHSGSHNVDILAAQRASTRADIATARNFFRMTAMCAGCMAPARVLKNFAIFGAVRLLAECLLGVPRGVAAFCCHENQAE
ncbi:hypothetical protein TSAR_005396, partial [Trichomalopsis sarcophagae]